MTESLQGDGTGDDGVDEALLVLADLADAPLRAHVAAFEAVHAALQGRLAESDRCAPPWRGSTSSWSGVGWHGRAGRRSS